MAARSIASLTLSFGLVSIPVRVFSATESAAAVSFNFLTKEGGRLKQQYVSEQTRQVVERADMVKGYEFEKDRFVLFTADELKALMEGSKHTIDIVSFVPEKSVDPIYFDKAYYLAPDKRGGKPYSLLLEAMRSSGRCAIATWAWKGKSYAVQVRAGAEGLVLQQLLYGAEVRSQKEIGVETVPVAQGELDLALQLITQIAADAYDPDAIVDEEKQRVLAAIDAKVAGKQVVALERNETTDTGQVIDLMDALRASLQKGAAANSDVAEPEEKERKPAKRAPVTSEASEDASPAAAPPSRVRARK